MIRDTTKRKEQACHFPVSIFHCLKCCADCHSQVISDNCVNYWRVRCHKFNETTLPGESTVYFPETSYIRFRMITADGPKGAVRSKTALTFSQFPNYFSCRDSNSILIQSAGYSVKFHYRTANQDTD
jgi:hypothetical protein